MKRKVHDCRKHLTYRCSTSTEPHGETYTQEWWECTVCGEQFDYEISPSGE